MKIFGIGMPKTGPSTLNRPLQHLGYRSFHYAGDPITAQQVRRGDYRLKILDQFDGLTDIPVPAIYAQLDEMYPDSKFILTVRDMEGWLDSCGHALFNQPEAVPEDGSIREFYRTLLYGCKVFNKSRFEWVHKTHVETVKRYFSGDNNSQLLIMDIAGGDQWDPLCRFLNKPVPPIDFPLENTRRLSP